MVKINSAFIKRTSILLFVCLFLLSACSTKDVKIFKGIVHTVDIENKKMLVISQLKEEDLIKGYKEVLDSGVYSHAIWVNKVTSSKYKQVMKLK